jgi:hypothetical protein
MCQDHSPSLDRRTLLRNAGVLAGAALVSGRAADAFAGTQRAGNRLQRARVGRRIVDPWGRSRYSNAMHIHSSFSEQDASMDAQLYQAARNSVDVLWWTDHDERMTAVGYPTQFHFTSFSEASGPGRGPWRWVPQKSGPLSSWHGGIVASPSSPNDPVSGGSLQLSAKAAGTAPASYGYYIDSSPVFYDYRASLSGQSITIDVMAPHGWTHGYMELLVISSVRKGPTTNYSMSYRFLPGKAGGKRELSASGTRGIVKIPVVMDGQTWTRVTVKPCDDVAALWPSVNAHDFGCYELHLNAVSSGDAVRGYFDYLRFSRASGGELFNVQHQIGAALGPSYPSVTQQYGLEISWISPHINWFGPDVQVLDYSGMGPKAWVSWLAQTAVPRIHSAGGLASYNHAFGTMIQALKPPLQQAQLIASTAASLLPSSGHPAVLGCDILEVGYNLRAGMPLSAFTALWDIFSRNAVFLTGSGVSDDHRGRDWLTANHGSGNNWVTTTWAASTQQADLISALTAGRVYCGSLAAPPVALDMLVDRQVPMGAVSVSSRTSRSLTLTAAGLPPGWTVALYQGDVDYAGRSHLVSNAHQVGSFGPGQLDRNGQATVTVDTSASSYLRTKVVSPGGDTRALSNPVWLLNARPPSGIPGPRQA